MHGIVDKNMASNEIREIHVSISSYITDRDPEKTPIHVAFT